MIGLATAAMLWAAAAPTSPSGSPAAPPSPTAQAPPAPAPADPPESAAETLAGLQGVYAQSCVDRAYGSFDDVCDQMARQIEVYRKKAAREARVGGRAAPTRSPPKPAPDGKP